MSAELVPAPDAYSESLKIALYGAIATKKTLQIGYLIDRYGQENVAVISCEHGLKTIESKLKDRKHVFVIAEEDGKASPIASFRTAWAWAEKGYNRPDAWVCVDGGSRVIEWTHDEIVGGTNAAYDRMMGGSSRQDLPEAIRKYGRFLLRDGEINTQAQWIELGNSTKRLLNSFLKLKSNLYWTFWADLTSKGQYEKGKPWRVDTPGAASADHVMKMFDFVGYLSHSPQGELMAGWNPRSEEYRAKVRDEWDAGIKVPETMREFRIVDLIDILTGKGA